MWMWMGGPRPWGNAGAPPIGRSKAAEKKKKEMGEGLGFVDLSFCMFS
jgi:hypothetical protein